MSRSTKMFDCKPRNVHKAAPGEPASGGVVTSIISNLSEEEKQAANIYFSTMQELSRRLSMQLFGRSGREDDALKIVDSVTMEINEMIVKKLPKATVPEMAALFSGAVGSAVGIAVSMDKTGRLREGLSLDMFDSLGAMFAMGVRLTAESVIERQENKVQLAQPSNIRC